MRLWNLAPALTPTDTRSRLLMTPDPCLDLQIATTTSGLPSEAQFNNWIRAALEGHGDSAQYQSELSVRIVNIDESQALNHQYRHKNSPTNVLSFPADLPPEVDIPLLGDLVVCAPVVATEAIEQKKDLEAHWAHMLIHGTLHLLGYDHINNADAEIMEQLETRILTNLGYPPPYEN